MDCIRPGVIRPEDLVAYVDGEAPAHVRAHVRQCRRCTADARSVTTVQSQLRHALYRFACPPPHTLGEYALELLSQEERQRIAAHVVDCPRCTEELAVVRPFLRDETVPQVGPVERLKRIVATLVLPPRGAAAYAGLRGADTGMSQTYRADGVTVTLSFEAERRGRFTVTGLVVEEASADTSVGAEVHLMAQPGETQKTGVDELGSFTFAAVPAGSYRLELHLAEEIVVVEGIQLGGT